MFRFDIIINLAMLIGFALILCLGVHRQEGAVRAVYCVFFCVCLALAYVLKLGLAEAEQSIFMPFHKLYDFSEYGSTGVIEDFFSYAMPYVLAGFLFVPAFPRFRIFAAFLAGLFISLCSDVYTLLAGGSFVTDEYLLAGIGMAIGCMLYMVVTYIFRKKIDFKEFKLTLPRHSSFIISAVLLLVIYIGIALTMILGYSEPYEDISFTKSAYTLPGDITLNCTLDEAAEKQLMYIPSTQSLEERLTAVAQSVGIYDEIEEVSGAYVAENASGKVTMTESGSWVYENYESASGDLPTRDEAVNAAFRFFTTRQILSTDIDKVTDIAERTDETSGTLIGYDVYLSSSVNGKSIVNSCAIVVSVRAGETITKVRRYDGDIQTGAQLNGISQQKAYEDILAGKGVNTLTAPAVSAEINSCELVYMQNSQGYYLPVWSFACTAAHEDGTTEEFSIYIQADK